MKNLWDPASAAVCSAVDFLGERKTRDAFRARFKRSVSQCVRRGFSMEECFGVIWEETLEVVCLSEEAQADLYNELIAWARQMEP